MDTKHSTPYHPFFLIDSESLEPSKIEMHELSPFPEWFFNQKADSSKVNEKYWGYHADTVTLKKVGDNRWSYRRLSSKDVSKELPLHDLLDIFRGGDY